MTPLFQGPLGTDMCYLRGSIFLGPFTAPPVLNGTLLVPLHVFVAGRVLIGLAWQLVLIALAVVIGIWHLGAIGTGFNLI